MQVLANPGSATISTMFATLILLATLSAADAEVARVQAHLAGAEAQLRTADVAHLSASQRANRARVIEQLAAYRARGEFPRNLDFAERTPYFIDDRGVRCAMAHLIEHNGGGALVARVAATANNARVRELAADPALIAWLDVHGMTAAEAARVQPEYSLAPGDWCDLGFSGCAGGACERPLHDDEDFGICTVPCEPGGLPCPRGLSDVQMSCEETAAGHRCHYPGQVPGSFGATCDPFGSGFCSFGPCVAIGSDGNGLCVETCFDTCPGGLQCRPWDANPSYSVCQLPPGVDEDRGGCSTSPGASLLAGRAALLGRRRRR
jgi:hypothetical protein